jgi:DNA primase
VPLSIPEEIIEKVREAADIVEVISDYLTLRQTGRSFKALCPFHSEKTPSFVVSREKQIYHCFGCGAGGNAINFLMQHDNVTFPEAVRSLARRYGIAVPKPTVQVGSETDIAYRLNLMAAKLWRAALSGTKEGTGARAYLRSRGINEETEKAFMLGYAPSEGNLVVQEGRRLKVNVATLASLGLAVSDERGARDLFRRRLMFPIPSAGGRVLGFGGRVLDAGQPKYLNSPETRVFKKSNTLYGIHAAKTGIRAAGFAILVEGYMDVIALHSHGFRNAVASLGTAFTPEQAKSLRRYSDSVVLVYDGDEAGGMATLRACATAAEADLKTSVARLSDGDDPDSYVRRDGPEALRSLLDGAVHYLDFVFSGHGREPEEVVKFALAIVGRIRDPIRAALETKRISDLSGVAESVLAKSLAATKTRSKAGEKQPEERRDVDRAPCDKVEKSLISILIGLPEHADRILKSVGPEDFTDHRMRSIVETVLERKSRGLAADASALLTVIDDAATREILLSCSAEDHVGNAERAVSDHILCVKKRVIGREIETMRGRIRAAEKEGDRGLLKTLLARRQSLANELKLLST